MGPRWPALLVSCLLLGTGAAAGEGPPVHPYVLSPGDKVRLWTAAGEAGTLVAQKAVVTATDQTGMMVVVRDRARLVPFQTLTRLEVRRGRSWARRGAVLGLAVGALTGAWLLADELVDGSAEADDRVRQGLIFGGAGAVAGGLSGAALHPARWEPVSIESVRPKPAAAARLSLNLRF